MTARAALTLLVAGAVAGCAAATPAPSGPRVSDQVRRTRVALGPVDDILVPEADPRPRLRALGDLAEQLGNGREACAAAVAVVELSRQRLVLALDHGGDAAAARRELARDRDHALTIVLRHGEHWRVGRLLDGVPAAAAENAAYFTVLEHGGWLDDLQLEAARAAATTPRQQALVERASRRPTRLTVADLRALGPEFLDLLERRLVGALDGGALETAVAAAQAIVALDALHLDARLLLAYDADRRAGWVLADARVARALVGPATSWERDRVDPRRSLAIVEQARRDAPRAASLTVGGAWILAGAGLPGEAASRLELPQAAELAELRDDVRGLLALEAGAVAVYRTWRTRRGGETSPFVTDVELRWLWDEHAPVQHAIAEEAAGRAVAASWPVLRRGMWGAVSRVAMDDRAPRALRQRAIARSSDEVERAVFHHCLSARLPRLGCQRLHDAFTELDSEEADDVTDAAQRLAVVPSSSATWLAGAAWVDLAQLRSLAPQILALEGTAASLTEAWVAMAVRAAMAQGDLDLARRLLAAHRGLLTPLVQVAADLAIADVAAGGDVEAAVGALGQLASTAWPVVTAPRADRERAAGPLDDDAALGGAADDDGGAPDDDDDAPDDDDGAPDGEAAVLAGAITRLYEDRSDSTAILTALRARHPGPEAAALDVVIALSAAADDEAAAAARALPDGVPERDLVTAMLGRRDRAAASAALSAYLARRVGSDWVRAAHAVTHAGSAHAGLIAPVDRDDLAAAVASGEDAWKLMARAGLWGHRPYARVAVADLEQVLQAAAATDIRARAGEALARARAIELDDRGRVAWLALVAGDVATARAVATAPSADRGRRGPDEPLAPEHPVRRLLDDRARLSDEVVRDLWRLLQRRDDAERGAVIERLLDDPAAGPGSAALACRVLVDADQADAAMAPCWTAWRGDVVDPDLAIAVTWLLLTRPDQAAEHGIDGAAFVTAAETRLAASDSAPLWINLALWYERRGDAARSEAMADRADHAGWDRTNDSIYYAAMAGPRSLLLRGVLGARLQANHGGMLERGRFALAAGDLVAARWYVAAAAGRAAGRVPHDERAAQEAFIELIELVSHDVAGDALTPADAGTWYRAFVDQQPITAELVAAHPRSMLIAVSIASSPDHAGRIDAAERLIAQFPANRMAVAQGARTLALAGRRDQARRALDAVRARFPDSALVASTMLAGGRAGGDWLASPDAFAAAVAATTPAELAALDPVRVVSGAAEAFVPRKKVGDGGTFDLELGGRIGVLETPNPTRCTGAACLDANLSSYPADWKVRWRRDDVAVGRRVGAQVLFDTPFGTVMVTLVASGGRLFQLLAVLPTENAEVLRPVIRLLHDTLQPLDLVVPADRAEALRDEVAVPGDGLRLRARRDLATAGCGWIPAGLDPAQRGALLLDVALLDPVLLPRAVACAEAGPATAPLAALALVADDAAASAFGRKVAADHGVAMVSRARTLLAGGQTQASLDLGPGNDRPRRGWLELAAALPAVAREVAVERLLASTESSERAAGILIAGLVPTAATRRRLRDELALAPAGFAQLAVEALPLPLEAADVAALRRRVDRATTTLEPAERRLLAGLARALERHGDPDDHKRLARVTTRLGRDPAATRPTPPPAAAAAGVRVSDDDLGRLPLAQLVDGAAWTYGRAPQPAALFASTRELINRIEVDGVTQQYMLRSIVDAMGQPMSLLGKDGGLDLSRPIECASSAADFVCTAFRGDAAALEATLAAWPEALAMIRVADAAPISGGAFAMLAGGAPVLAERIFDEPDADGATPDDDGDDDGFALFSPATPGRRLLHERLRLTTTVAGRTLVRHLVVSAGDDGRSKVEGPGMLLVGDRLFVFSSPAMAERILHDLPAAGTALADSPAFRAATADWVDGVAVYGVITLATGNHTAFTMVPEADGLRFRIRNVDKKPTAPARAIGLLPPGASSVLATSGLSGDDGDDTIADAMGPRRWMFEGKRELAFGWYPAAAGVTDGWVVATRWDRKLEKAAAAHGLGKLGRGVRTAGALHGARHGDYLVIGSRLDLVRTTLTRRLEAPDRDGRNWVSRLDGPALAAALRARPVTTPERTTAVTLVALAAEVMGKVEATSRRIGGADVMEGVIRPRLASADDTRAVVDRWLTTPQLRNTTRLPRELAPAEVDRPLSFVIELADAGAVATRLFPATPRTRVEVLDAQRVRVVVTPAPALADRVTAVPIDAAARKRALADGADVRTSHTRIKQLARELVAPQARPADAAVAIGTWVHQHLAYEVTASGGDAIDILERRSGDCTEYSLLTVSLLRAAGVPAETRFGVAAGGGELVAHAWVAFHDGTAWREIDPTWGRTSVGADHIETSIMDFVALVSLDKLTITAIETATAATAP